MKEINFSAIPIFAGLDRIELAKLIPSLIEESFRAGTILFRKGDPGDALYIIVSGNVQVLRSNHGLHEMELARFGPGVCFGEMALLTGKARSADVRAVDDLTVLKLSRESFDELIRRHHSLALHFAGVLSERLARADAALTDSATDICCDGAGDGQCPPDDHAHHHDSHGLPANVKWLITAGTAGLCLLSGIIFHGTGFSYAHIVILELLIVATVFWSLEIIPYHAVSIALPMAVVLFGVSSPEKAFSGFSQPYWFLALGVFGLSAAIFRTGLLYRMALGILKRFPPNYIGQTFGIAAAGLLLTPLIPSAYSRSILASPIAVTQSETLRLKKGSPGTIGVAMACLLGFGHMSFMFMNGTASCAFVLGLLPSSARAMITWDTWLLRTLPFGLLFFVISYVAILFLYRPEHPARLCSDVVEAQLKTLGPMTLTEKVTLVTIFITLVGFATEQWHHVEEAWIALLGFIIVFASSALEEQSIRSDMDWSFLLALGAMVGFGDVIADSGMVTIMVQWLSPVLSVFCGNSALILVIFSLVVHALRWALPITPALLVSMTAGVPTLASVGIDPFVGGVVALASCNPWVLKQQNSIFRNIWKATGTKLFYHEDTIKLAILHIFIVALCVALSVPYWQVLGLIR